MVTAFRGSINVAIIGSRSIPIVLAKHNDKATTRSTADMGHHLRLPLRIDNRDSTARNSVAQRARAAEVDSHPANVLQLSYWRGNALRAMGDQPGIVHAPRMPPSPTTSVPVM